MKKIKQLGIFDSGLGGYSIYRDLKRHLEPVSLVLYADQGNAPYGNQSPEAIIQYTEKAMMWFHRQGILDVIVACNTVSAVALETIRSRFPDMKIVGIIELTVENLTNPEAMKVAVVSTLATFNSHAYRDLIECKSPLAITELALPELVNIIEGLNPNLDIEKYLEIELIPVMDATDLILGCTHFPLVYDVFSKKFNGRIHDSIVPIRNYVCQEYQFTETGCHTYTTGDPKMMEAQIQSLFGDEEKVELI